MEIQGAEHQTQFEKLFHSVGGWEGGQTPGSCTLPCSSGAGVAVRRVGEDANDIVLYLKRM